MPDILAMMTGSPASAPKAGPKVGVPGAKPTGESLVEGGDGFSQIVAPLTGGSGDDATDLATDSQGEGDGPVDSGSGDLGPGSTGREPATFVAGLVALDDVALDDVALNDAALNDAALNEMAPDTTGPDDMTPADIALADAVLANGAEDAANRGAGQPSPSAVSGAASGIAADAAASGTAPQGPSLATSGNGPRSGVPNGPAGVAGTPVTQHDALSRAPTIPPSSRAGQDGASQGVRIGQGPTSRVSDVGDRPLHPDGGVKVPAASALAGRATPHLAGATPGTLDAMTGFDAAARAPTTPGGGSPSGAALSAGAPAAMADVGARPAPDAAGAPAAPPRASLRAGAEAVLQLSGTAGGQATEAVETLLSGDKSVGQATRAAALAQSTTQAGVPTAGAGVAMPSPGFDLAALLGGGQGADAQEFDPRGERPAMQGEARAATHARAGVDGLALGRMFAAPTGAVPLRDVALQVARKASGGATRFQIRLDPPELGRIDVSLEMRGETTTVRLVAERSETLDALARDARGLERALQDAGVKADAGTMEFSLGQDARDQASDDASRGGMRREAPEASDQPERREGARRMARPDALLDLMI